MFFRKKQPVKLYWWRYEPSPTGNFGDEITRHIITKVFKKDVHWAPPPEADIVGTGSIIDIVLKEKNDNHPIIWGSGFIEPGTSQVSYEDCRVALVRGTSTLGRVANIPAGLTIPTGDPGLLANKLIKVPRRKKYKLGVIPHYVDFDDPALDRFKTMPETIVIDPTKDCLAVLRQIADCETIISSSLHGLIVSDSFGTPNLHILLSENLKGGLYKFYDYYSAFSTDRYQQQRIDTLPENADAIASLIKDAYVIPSDLAAVQQRIIKSFPESS